MDNNEVFDNQPRFINLSKGEVLVRFSKDAEGNDIEGRTTIGGGFLRRCDLTNCSLNNCTGADSQIVNSDQDLKNTIQPLSLSYLNLIKNVQPVSYKYNNGTSDRLHTGFIAQQVEQSIINSGLTSQEFAALVKNKDTGLYGLRYEEFIALNTMAIQDLYKYIEKLEARIKELEGDEKE